MKQLIAMLGILGMLLASCSTASQLGGPYKPVNIQGTPKYGAVYHYKIGDTVQQMKSGYIYRIDSLDREPTRPKVAYYYATCVTNKNIVVRQLPEAQLRKWPRVDGLSKN